MLDLFTSDPYETLGVDKDADLATIRKAHRKLVLQCHPDKLRDENREEGTRRFGEVTKAYELLVDETRRQRYDAGVKLAKWRLESQVTGRNELRQTGRTNEVPLPREYLGNAWFHQDADRIRRDRYDPFYSYSHERRARRRERSVKSVLDYRFFFSPFGSKERRERFERRRRERERRERERRGTEGIRSLEQYEKYRRQYEIWEQQRLRFLGLPLSIPKRLAKKSAAGILALEGFVNGNFVCTNPDTGAQANLIALSFAESIGLHLINREPELQVGFRMANGNMIYSIGQVNAQWCFKKGSSESYDISFYVFAECCFDVLIGDPFLRATQTMSTNEHRLSWVPRPKWALYVRRVNLLGCPSQQMKGKLSGEEVFALADTGAEGGNLVSYDYAQRRGWLASDLSGERNLLQFPDGSQSRTEGQVRKVWRYHGALGYEKKIAVVFDVLYDLPFDVILGQDFLQATDAFTKHKRCFHDLTVDDDCLGLSLVIWKGKNSDRAGETASVPRASSLEQEAEDELERRAANNQKIGKIKDSAMQESAARDEKKRIEDWERDHPDIWRSNASPGLGSQPTPQRFSGTQPSPAGPQTLHSHFMTAV